MITIKFKVLIVTAILPLFLYSFVQSENKFLWLQGTWEIQESPTKSVQEVWVCNTDNSLSGTAIEIDGNNRKVVESIEIVYRDNTYWYIPTVSGQNNGIGVPFKLSDESDHRFIFENTQHDFPNRIIYHYKPLNGTPVVPPMAGDTLDIRVESLTGEGFDLRFFRI